MIAGWPGRPSWTDARCKADWGSATASQQCVKPPGHDGSHLDREGHEWPAAAGAAMVPGLLEVARADAERREQLAAVDPGPVPPDKTPADHIMQIYASVYERGLRLILACDCGQQNVFPTGAGEAVLHDAAERHRKGAPLG